MEKIVIACVLLLVINCTSAALTTNCMKCICEVEGCEKNIGKCNYDVNSDSCGPYQIKNPYWIDCGKPGNDWRTCTKQLACSETCVQKNLNHYGPICNKKPTCETYARVHNGGPNGCKYSSTVGYWEKVAACCRKRGNCNWIWAAKNRCTLLVQRLATNGSV